MPADYLVIARRLAIGSTVRPGQCGLMASRSRPHHPRRSNASAGDPSLLFGLHAVAAAWANPMRQCRRIWATRNAWNTLSDQVAAPPSERPAPKLVDRDELDRLVGPSSIHQGLVLDAAPLSSPSLDALAASAPSGEQSVVVMLDQVTDPHNVGAILRSASVFGAIGMIVQDRHAPPITGTLARSASGAVDHVPIVRATNLARALEKLRDAGFYCIGLAEQADKPLADIDAPDRTVLILGAEGAGLRRLTRERCDVLASLPSRGALASLNVSNAAAVALYAVTSA
jgi:23S rRNA (guanosine2251-2'-O)-methyltransferase